MLLFPAAPSQIPSSGICAAAATCCLAFSPLPDRNGRNLVDDWDGTIYFYGECRFIPPHQSLTRQLPPEGKPSLHCANTANVAYMADMSNISLSCGLPLRFALVALSCSAKRLLQKGFPLGWKLSRKRLMRGDKSALTKAIHSPTHPAHQSGAKPHFLPPRTSQSTQKLPCTATAVQKARIIHTHQSGGCRAGKFGEGQGGLEGSDRFCNAKSCQ